MNQEVVAIPTEAWIQEQYNVASQVIVLPDPKSLPFVFVPKYTSSTDEEVNDTVAPMQSVPRFVDMVVTDDDDHPATNPCYYYGGVDVSFPEPGRHDNDHTAVAVYVILEYPSFQVVYQEYIYFPLTVPYIPSFLAFREIEPIQSLIQQQLISHPQYTPTAILVDGNGIFHPRYAGLACFVGVRTGIPTIGIGKTLYCDIKMGRTKETMHRTIYNSMRNCCCCGRASNIGDGSCCSDTQSRPSPAPNDTQVKHNHSSACIVTFDCHVETSPLLIHDDHSEDDDVNHSRYRSLAAEGSSTTTTVTTTLEERTHYMMELSQTKCIGLAIPIGGMIRPHDMIQNRTNHHENNITNITNDDTTVSILAYALVGHGGRIRGRTTPKYQRNGPQKTTNPTLSSQHSFRCPRTIPGTSNPIYISVGHAISLQDAVLICARLSLSRIPEPVRLADLHGRAVLRDHKSRGPNQTNTSQFTRKK